MIRGRLSPEPLHLEFAVTPDARARLSPAHHITVREIVYAPGDLEPLDAHLVTTPLRTILDLARFSDPFDAATVRRLAAIAGLGLDDCLAALASRAGIPAKKRARENLREALTAPAGEAIRRSGG